MRPLAPLVLVLGSALALLVSACGSSESSVQQATAAPPQRAELDWEERYPEAGPGLVFRVRAFAVTEEGWEADLEIENRTAIPWGVGDDPVAVGQSFGIMLFATGDLEEVEQRSREGDLPGLRPARAFAPTLPTRLEPGGRWRGTASAPGSLAAGRHVRVVFGPLAAVGEPPDGMASQLQWITDHAHRLHA